MLMLMMPEICSSRRNECSIWNLAESNTYRKWHILLVISLLHGRLMLRIDMGVVLIVCDY